MKLLKPQAKKQKFRVIERALIFQKGPIQLVDCRIQMASGKIISRQIFEHPGSVVIIPKITRNKFIIIRQFRFASRDWLWEFPAGGLEKGESVKCAAVRELMEEVGYRPKKLRKLLHFYPSPGVSSERMHLFLAEDLVPDKAVGDEDEEIQSRIVSSKEIEKMIRGGEIVDAKTVAGYFFLKRFG